jgi:hypothetical protein
VGAIYKSGFLRLNQLKGVAVQAEHSDKNLHIKLKRVAVNLITDTINTHVRVTSRNEVSNLTSYDYLREVF